MVSGTEGHNVGPGDHAVLFYRDDGELAGRVSEYLLEAIRDSGVAIVIATPAHRRSFEARLAQAGVDVAAACASGTYLPLDARQTLRQFLIGDWPSPAGFWQAVSPVIRQATKAGKPVHAFGEMVALLWDAGLVNAAVELEAMWNELIGQYPFALFCAYPADSVGTDSHLDALTEVCRVHGVVAGVSPEPGHDQGGLG